MMMVWMYGIDCMSSPCRILTILGIVGALVLAFDRTTWLPFLGETVMPTTALRERVPPGSTNTVTVRVPSKEVAWIMYWAANPGGVSDQHPMDAYRGFQNTGVVRPSPDTDFATLWFKCPGQYTTPRGYKPLDKHVHYRFVFQNGWVSEVKTSKIDCNCAPRGGGDCGGCIVGILKKNPKKKNKKKNFQKKVRFNL
jgi:hypothetical protein